MARKRWLLDREVDVLDGEFYGKSGRITAVDDKDYTIFCPDESFPKVRRGFVRPSLSLLLLLPNDFGFRVLFRPSDRVYVCDYFLNERVGKLLSGNGKGSKVSCRFSNNFLPIMVATRDCCLIRFITGDVVSFGRGPPANSYY
jgi:hypothetical protein